MIINCRKRLINFLIFILALFVFSSGCSFPGKRKDVPKIEMIVENPLSIKRTDEFVVLKVAMLKEEAPDFSPNTFIVLDVNSNQDIPHQLDDMDNDGEGDEIAMILDMEPGEKKNIVIRYAPEGRPVVLGYKRRTRTAVHPEYEGIGWESELIAYRVYPDYRNSISVFGKQEQGLSLDKYAASVSGRGYNYLEPWGVNVLEGGGSVGCGGFGIWYKNGLIKPISTKPGDAVSGYTRVLADGPIRSAAQVIFKNWRIGDQTLKVTATYSIFAGQRWTRNQIKIEGADSPVKIAAGLTKSLAAKLTRDEKNGFFFTWGPQSHRSPPDNLGMALIYPSESFDSFYEDDKTGAYLSVLNPGTDNEIAYWSQAVWNRGDIGVREANQFADLVSSVTQRIKNPLTVTIIPGKTSTSETSRQGS